MHGVEENFEDDCNDIHEEQINEQECIYCFNGCGRCL